MNPIRTIASIIIGAILVICVLAPTVEGVNEVSELDVIIIDGQSNAEYSTNTDRTNALAIDLPEPEYKLMYFGTESYAEHYPGFDNAQIWEMNRDGQWMIGGLEPYLAYTYSERSGHDVLTINVARGAMSISWLAPSGAGGQYAQEVIADALSQIQGYDYVNMVGWVMLQGEHDKTMAIDTYKEYFLELADYFDSIGATQCYIGATREYWGGNATAAQTELAEEYSNIHIATEVSETFSEEDGTLVSDDPIHYSQKGRDIVAEDIGEYMKVVDHTHLNLLRIVPVVFTVMLLATAIFWAYSRNRE